MEQREENQEKRRKINEIIMKYSGYNIFLTIVHILCLLVLSCTLIIKSIFSSTDSINTHLKEAGLYVDVSNMVKARVSENLNQRFEDKIVQRAMAERLLDAIVTPEFVEKQSQRVLPIAAKVIEKPLDIQNNKVIVDTKNYKDKVTSEVDNPDSKIPDLIQPAATNLIATIPDQLTLVDMEKRPNSVLGYLTKAKILYENISVWNSTALTVGIITALLLIIINSRQLRALFKYLTIAYLVSGGIILLGSYLFPYLIMLMNTGPNIYLNEMIRDATYYVFEQTRTPSIIYLVFGGLFYCIFRWYDALKVQANKLFHTSESAKKSKSR